MTPKPIEQHWVQQPGSRITGVVRAETFAHAAELLARERELRPVAGGTDLLLDLARDRTGGTARLLDLTSVDGYGAMNFDDPSAIRLAAGVTHAAIVSAPEARQKLLPLAQACLEIGSPQLRNRATIVGNLATASPANDTISALLALDARVHIISQSVGGLVEREVNLQDFYTGFRATDLRPGELIDCVLVPQPTSRHRGIWVKAGLRKAQAISVVHAGIVLELADDDTVETARIALGSVGPSVELSEAAAQILVGQGLTPEVVSRAAVAAAESVHPIDDGRATAEYRSDVIVAMISRALSALANGHERDQWPTRVPLLVATGAPEPQVVSPSVFEFDTDISASVNGAHMAAPSPHSGTLLDWLRATAGTGTKEGCAEGECGACTVQLDGKAVMSCLVLASQAHGSEVVTVEGLGSGESPSSMQQSFVDKFAVQCGYCIPGFVVAAQILADELDSPPSREEIELALSGNLCRCTGYYNIIDAVSSAMAAAAST